MVLSKEDCNCERGQDHWMHCEVEPLVDCEARESVVEICEEGSSAENEPFKQI